MNLMFYNFNDFNKE